MAGLLSDCPFWGRSLSRPPVKKVDAKKGHCAQCHSNDTWESDIPGSRGGYRILEKGGGVSG